MSSQAALPVPSYVWGVLLPRIAAAFKAKEPEMWELSGLSDEYGPPSDNFTGEREATDMTDELTGLLMCAIALDLETRENASSIGRRIGRPRDVMIPFLGPNLLSFFLRFHDWGGRHSVAIGAKSQKEAGPLFLFIQAAVEPLNQYLLEVNSKVLSPARLARFALSERRHISRLSKRAKQLLNK
jgi:hypothetical protein